MLLKTFRPEIVSNHCMPGAMSVNGIAWLDQDVGCALPYLNAVLGAIEYIKEPPTDTFRTQVVEILKHLPRTNCRECRQPTCMVFALRLAEGAKGSEDCPYLDGGSKAALDEYLNGS